MGPESLVMTDEDEREASRAPANVEACRVLLREIDIAQRSREGTLEHALARIDALAPGGERDASRRRVLDAPCGPGLMSEALVRLGFDVTGADLDAAQFARRGSIPFCEVDLDAPLPFADRHFDAVYCGDGVEHLENPFSLLRELSRVLCDGGILLVVTPNYSNIESRMRLLFTGALTKPVERHPGFHRGRRFDRGHINPLTLTRLARMAEYADLVLLEATTLLPKPRQRVLAPLAGLVRLYGSFLPPIQRERLFADATQSWRILLGGKQLLAVFRRAERR